MLVSAFTTHSYISTLFTHHFHAILLLDEKKTTEAKASKTIATSTLEKWKEFVLEKKVEKTHTIDGDLIVIKNSTVSKLVFHVYPWLHAHLI